MDEKRPLGDSIFVATGDSQPEFLDEARDAFRHARTANGSKLRPEDACPDIPAAELLDASGMQAMADASQAILGLAEQGGLMVLGLSCLFVAAVLSSEAGASESAIERLARGAYDTATGSLGTGRGVVLLRPLVKPRDNGEQYGSKTWSR